MACLPRYKWALKHPFGCLPDSDIHIKYSEPFLLDAVQICLVLMREHTYIVLSNFPGTL